MASNPISYTKQVVSDFLGILVLREAATGVKQRVGLELRGIPRGEYLGLSPDLAFVREWASRRGRVRRSP